MNCHLIFQGTPLCSKMFRLTAGHQELLSVCSLFLNCVCHVVNLVFVYKSYRMFRLKPSV
jgi:hypothetical protein